MAVEDQVVDRRGGPPDLFVRVVLSGTARLCRRQASHIQLIGLILGQDVGTRIQNRIRALALEVQLDLLDVAPYVARIHSVSPQNPGITRPTDFQRKRTVANEADPLIPTATTTLKDVLRQGQERRPSQHE